MDSVKHGDRVESPLEEGELKLERELTVEAWVRSETRSAEAFQVIASQWRNLATFDTFDAYDAGDTSGLDTRGFFGAVFDGRYVYFAPQHNLTQRHGNVLRYDTHAAFGDRASWLAYDAGRTSGLDTRGYYGAVFDGRHVYFVPRYDGERHHSRLLRYDADGDFLSPESWTAYDLGLANSFQSGAYDGRYVYLCPGYTQKGGNVKLVGFDALAACGRIVRYDTRSPFADEASYAAYDASHTPGIDARCFDGAIFDGRYVYFAPLMFSGVLRHDTRGAYDDPDGWKGFDAAPLGMGRCVGAIFDGRYVYFVPYGRSSTVVRHDTLGDFADRESWSSHDAWHTSGLHTRGYDGAAFDGRYVIFIAYQDEAGTFHANMLRYDTQADFDDPAGWTAHDAEPAGGIRPRGFNAGAFDGRYLYCAPWNAGETDPSVIEGNGRVLRYDTVREQGAFRLLYADCGHNGGLCGAVPGPCFIVNTPQGARSVAAHRILEPGRHHIAGVYDGASIKLFINGELVRQRAAGGAICANDEPVAVGRVPDGAGRFKGDIERVQVSDTARNADWIQTTYEREK